MVTRVDPAVRNAVRISGAPDGRILLFAHGFGGSQDSWRHVAPAFEADSRVVLFDHVGAGASDASAYDRVKYDSLHGYADDVVEIIEHLGLTDVVFVGHSVSGMIGVLAANRRPDLFSLLVLVGPSPRYVDDDGYTGGFTREAIDDLLTSLESNYVSFSNAIAPVLIGDPSRPDLTADVTVPTVILQSAQDNIAGPGVGRYVHEHIPGSRLEIMPSRGHIPNLSDPDVLVRHIRAALG